MAGAVLRAAGYRTAYVGKWHMGQQRGQRPGFDYSASYIAHGRYGDCPFEINGQPTATKGWVDDVSTDFAIAFIKQNQAKPFSLVVGFKSRVSLTRLRRIGRLVATRAAEVSAKLQRRAA